MLMLMAAPADPASTSSMVSAIPRCTPDKVETSLHFAFGQRAWSPSSLPPGALELVSRCCRGGWELVFGCVRGKLGPKDPLSHTWPILISILYWPVPRYLSYQLKPWVVGTWNQILLVRGDKLRSKWSEPWAWRTQQKEEEISNDKAVSFPKKTKKG